MQRKCDICGREENEHFMQPYNIGSKVKWLCWDCFKNAQHEAYASDRYRQKKLYKIKQSKKRSGKL